ncbi:MAG: hypothetical protein N3G22_04885 [Candidatus Micrarchaeota archaeon]|nr:hypothetical protein [Candidatus Micrarchaeota archaeon]
MDELSFLDLAILKKIDNESSVEKFGSLINTSFFETANLLGTIKIKGYINIESSVGGISRVSLTEAGSNLLAAAAQRAEEPIDPLDTAALQALAAGAKDLDSITQKLNIRSSDLAFHLNKLVHQGYIDYEVRSAKVSFVLTEKGFNYVGSIRTVQPPVSPQPAAKQEAEESEELPPRIEKASAPPWVKPEGVIIKEKKEDILHLLKGEPPAKEEKKEHAEKHHEHKHHKKPLTPEQQKAEERRKRLISKMEYYLVEYAPYLILIMVVAAIFIVLAFLSLTKLG